ncbi:C40 family peptidase [Herbiconiux sp. SYSU D00978]|uniref:C40 family peptidase n=1 Tax=Herbiconiux sp. SYSU D00978 TaxID=2812562 RepID=UPI001A95B7B7|nr:C40 family peptidase [Herbiconiux sp. SYSU D00978]
MSVADIAARMNELAARFSATPSTSGAASAASAASATEFASVLSAAGVEDTNSLLPTTGEATGSAVVAAAKQYLGVPYVFGGTTREGMDCSGLVQRVFADLGIDVPRLVSGQGALGQEIPSLAEAKPGDLVVADDNSHIGIYVGDGKMLHAPRAGKDVQIADLWWNENEMTIRRLVPAEAGATAPAAASQADIAAALRSTMLGTLSGAGR